MSSTEFQFSMGQSDIGEDNGYLYLLIPSPASPRKRSLKEAHLSERLLFSSDDGMLFCRQFFCVPE